MPLALKGLKITAESQLWFKYIRFGGLAAIAVITIGLAYVTTLAWISLGKNEPFPKIALAQTSLLVGLDCISAVACAIMVYSLQLIKKYLKKGLEPAQIDS